MGFWIGLVTWLLHAARTRFCTESALGATHSTFTTFITLPVFSSSG